MRRFIVNTLSLALWLSLAPLAPAQTQDALATSANQTTQGIAVNGRICLASFMSLSDNHIQRLADALQMLVLNGVTDSGKWDDLKGPMRRIAEKNVPAALWYALPDGTYWTLEAGRTKENLSDRPYFAQALTGRSVIGNLVVSKSTGKSSAIVAVPILKADKTVAGVLGASIYLDRLSDLIRQEMALDESVIFYSFDATPIVGLDWNPGLIMSDPTKLGKEVADAFTEMLKHEEGLVTYRLQDIGRTVLYKKSPLTGWWYAFGVVSRASEKH